MSAPNPDELDAVDMTRLASGHDAALNDLMERHGGRLFHYLVRCLQNEEDASDLAQECFVKVYQNRRRYDPRQKFSTWLYAIASNLVRDRYRLRSRHPQVSLDAPNETTGDRFVESLREEHPVPSDELEASERVAAIRAAVGALPEELRQPLILAEYEERSHTEIGAILGCTAKAVESRIYRARQQLRTRLGGMLGGV